MHYPNMPAAAVENLDLTVQAIPRIKPTRPIAGPPLLPMDKSEIFETVQNTRVRPSNHKNDYAFVEGFVNASASPEQ
jgi:hypothetical protein